jgi:signal transduction histidine kinase
MKFRYKLIVTIIFLLGLSFGIGGTILIDSSFKSSLSYAEESDLQNFENVQNTLMIAASLSDTISYDDLASVLSQLAGDNNNLWANVSLKNMENLQSIYDMNTDIIPIDTAENDDFCSTVIWTDGHYYYYQISNTIMLNHTATNDSPATGRLDILYDISSIYQSRIHNQRTFRILLATILLCGSILAVILSAYLTKPLEKLSHMANDISNGNYSSRADIHSGDEIENLADNLNTMAGTIEENISDLQNSIDRQEQFMGSFAHELKTPMTSIIGYADLLRSHDMNAEETNEAANYIFSEGKRLESLSLKLLELLVVKNEDTILQPADPAAVIKNVVNITKPELTKANIDLKSTCRKGNCMLDNDLFQSLIINIVDNARKAMDNGGDIHISGTVKDDKYVIIIKDNGRGMPPEEIDRISEAFYRVDKSRSRAQGGAGLGLSICSKIAEIHNATLKFKSEVGRGTVVTISLKQVEG